MSEKKDRWNCFTIVFEGDISKLPFNPMKAETIFGRVISSGYGNAFEEVRLRVAEELDDLRKQYLDEAP